MTSANNNNNNDKFTSAAIVSEHVRSYANDPAVVKKADESKVFLDKVGFPKEFMSKK